jgi:hypothetical protein
VREDSRRFSMHFHGQGTSCKGLWKFPLAGKRPLTCCIKEVTHHKLENQFNVLLTFCQAHMGENLPTSDSGIYNMLSFFLAFFGGLVPVHLCFPPAVAGTMWDRVWLASAPVRFKQSNWASILGASNPSCSCRWRGSTWVPPTVLPTVDGGDRPGHLQQCFQLSMEGIDLGACPPSYATYR